LVFPARTRPPQRSDPRCAATGAPVAMARLRAVATTPSGERHVRWRLGVAPRAPGGGGAPWWCISPPPPRCGTVVVRRRRPTGLWREVRHRGGASFFCYCAGRWDVLATGLAVVEAEVGCSRRQDGGGRRARRPSESPWCGDDDNETKVLGDSKSSL
jgi:hypothetical protein